MASDKQKKTKPVLEIHSNIKGYKHKLDNMDKVNTTSYI